MEAGGTAADLSSTLGPFLVLDGADPTGLSLAAILLAPEGEEPPPVEVEGESVAPEPFARFGPTALWRARFRLPLDRRAGYRWNGTDYPVETDLTGDIRIAFVSCNGEEEGDLDRADAERNLMWARLRQEHMQAPFGLLLHGGDQIYADEAVRGHPLSDGWPDHLPRDPSRHDLEDLREWLRVRFMERYAAMMAMPDHAWLVARIPSLAQWDDHDICDGWGSLARSRTYSPVGQTLFEVAREAALAFQHGTTDGDLPARFDDADGRHLSWAVDLPGLRILAPDLRSERTRRDVMSEAGWAAIEGHAQSPSPGRTLLLSTVPLLGPRLSLLEMLMVLIPKMQEYEDDLRDQWQSRAHRASWRRMLRAMLRIDGMPHQDVTFVSGEIHLATRATLAGRNGRRLHQLVASGITHRAPPGAWARALHFLAALGEAPLPAHPIRIERLPGQRLRYVAERNYMVLERRGSDWRVRWELEHGGTTPPLQI